MAGGENKDGHRFTPQLAEQERYLQLTPVCFPEGSYHSNSFVKGHTKQHLRDTPFMRSVLHTQAQPFWVPQQAGSRAVDRGRISQLTKAGAQRTNSALVKSPSMPALSSSGQFQKQHSQGAFLARRGLPTAGGEERCGTPAAPHNGTVPICSVGGDGASCRETRDRAHASKGDFLIQLPS